jgi:glutathione-regulated potassium-efflux system ancillary protein KefC/glutathione-regulated potassium-efflux system protein KefB
VFTAAALLVVIGAALLMEAIGLSMSLGAFLAGVLLADSEFRHELEADVDPFKGLLLGLFFMAVGMSANLSLLAAHPLPVLGVALGLMVVKAVLLYIVARVAGSDSLEAQRIAVLPRKAANSRSRCSGRAARASSKASRRSSPCWP